VGKPEGNRALGRPLFLMDDNIKMDVTVIELICLKRSKCRAVVNSVMNTQNAGIACLAEELELCREGLFTVELVV
jgi:hypothetical protein